MAAIIAFDGLLRPSKMLVLLIVHLEFVHCNLSICGIVLPCKHPKYVFFLHFGENVEEKNASAFPNNKGGLKSAGKDNTGWVYRSW